MIWRILISYLEVGPPRWSDQKKSMWGHGVLPEREWLKRGFGEFLLTVSALVLRERRWITEQKRWCRWLAHTSQTMRSSQRSGTLSHSAQLERAFRPPVEQWQMKGHSQTPKQDERSGWGKDHGAGLGQPQWTCGQPGLWSGVKARYPCQEVQMVDVDPEMVAPGKPVCPWGTGFLPTWEDPHVGWDRLPSTLVTDLYPCHWE